MTPYPKPTASRPIYQWIDWQHDNGLSACAISVSVLSIAFVIWVWS